MSRAPRTLPDVEAVAAEEVDGGGCSYRNCSNDADLLVEFRDVDTDARETVRMCDSCDRANHIHARANDLTDNEVTAS